MVDRIQRKRPTFPDIDYSKPVDQDTIGTTASEADCFTFLWEPEDRACAMCNDNLICGLMFQARLEQKAKMHKKDNGNYLDDISFDSINRDDCSTWLLHKPRMLKEFEALIQRHSECPDKKTTHYWCTSFLKEYKFKIVEGIIVKP